MSTTEAPPATRLAYDVFVNDPPPQDGVLPNGEPNRFSPTASTLIYGSEDGVLTDPPTPATAVTVPENRLTLEDHDLVIVEVGDTDSADTTVLPAPSSKRGSPCGANGSSTTARTVCIRACR